jgi:tyrosyl-tRNA synthetase
VGKHVTVNSMIAKDSVRSRMEERASGISFAEFSYMLLQAFDFHHLRQAYGCELQIGASDQWGNITLGAELTRKKMGATVWGLVFPLLLKPDGTKYGKTAEGAVWLDPRKTSPYRFYQFFVNADDGEVVTLLGMLTFLEEPAIAELQQAAVARPEERRAQRALAREMTTLVHGEAAARSAAEASAILFGGPVSEVTESALREVEGEVPTSEIARARLDAPGTPVVDLVVHAGLAASKGEGRRAVESGGVYVNNARVESVSRTLTSADLLFGTYVLLRRGKRNYALVRAK